MAIRSLNQLKKWFQKGCYPTAAQFGDWMDSFFHKNDTIPVTAMPPFLPFGHSFLILSYREILHFASRFRIFRPSRQTKICRNCFLPPFFML